MVFSHSHSRTSSLPCTSHPLVSHLEAEIHGARSRLALSDRDPTGLCHIDALISTVEQVLTLPVSRDSFCHAECTDRLLDDLLSLADVYGSIRSVAITLKQNHAELHSALRRRDATWLSTSVRTQRHIEKEISQLASTVRHVTSGSTSDTELGGVVREAVTVVAAASAEVLSKVVSTSSAAASSAMATTGSSRVSLMEGLFKKRCSEEEKELVAMERLDALEACIVDLERGSERVFRSLVKARVSLLNAVTLSF